MKTSGKTLTIFLVIIVILLLCLNAVTLYLNQKESERRKSAEAKLDQMKSSQGKIEEDLKEAKKQVFLLEEKNKEADEKINDLMDNIEVEQGLKDSIKQENQTLKEALDSENQTKEKLRGDMDQELTAAKDKASKLETQLADEQKKVKDLEDTRQSLEDKIKQMETDLDKKIEKEAAPPNMSLNTPAANSSEVHLDPIVVAEDIPEGRVLSVDKDNEFLIFNLGEKHGIEQGAMMSIYRGQDYLGDVKVSRVQPEMSAADFIPPFSSQKVRKNDQVVVKK